MLPEDNMWTNEEFEQYLKKRGCGNVWESVVIPGMKEAVIAAMEACQDVLEPRKVSITCFCLLKRCANSYSQLQWEVVLMFCCRVRQADLFVVFVYGALFDTTLTPGNLSQKETQSRSL